jgi:heat shock protein HslJ
LVNVATTSLGDRAQINSLIIEQDQIVVEMVTHSPDDPMCCPTQIVRDTFALEEETEEETLVPVASEVIGTLDETVDAEVPAELLGKVWYWQEFVDTAGLGDITVDDPAKYTLEFLPDGTYRILADCNHGSGAYTVDGNRLTLMPGPITLAACGPASLDTQFLSHLGDVVTYVLEDGKLYLNLKMDAGDMVFSSEAAAESPGGDITGIVWKWEQTTTPVDVTTVDDPDAYTIELLPDGRFRFKADCNVGSGTYTLDGSHVSFELGPMTLAACAPGSLSDQFIKDLSAAAIYFLEGEDLFIDLKFDSGTMRFSSGAPRSSTGTSDLEGVEWALVSIGGEDVPPDAEITALFDAGKVPGSAGCNSYFGGYELDGEALSVSPLGTTRMACPEPLMALETAFVSALTSAETYRVCGDTLEIAYDGGSLIFTK